MLLAVQVLLVGLRPRAADLAHLAVEHLHGLPARVPPLTLAAVAVVVEAAAAAAARMSAPVAELGRARLARQLTPLGAAVLRPAGHRAAARAHHVGRVGGRVIAGRGRGAGGRGRGRALLRLARVLVALGRARDRDAIGNGANENRLAFDMCFFFSIRPFFSFV